MPLPDRARTWTAAVLLAALLVYGLSPVTTPFDSRWSVHTAMSLLRWQGGSLAADVPVLAANQYYAIAPGGEPRTIYPIGVSLLAAPAVLLVATLDPSFEAKLRDRIPARFEHWFASVIGAVAAALFFRLLLFEFRSRATALAGTVAFALGTTMWSDATRALWQHGPLVLFLILAMLALQRGRTRPTLIPLAGPALAAAYLMRPTAAIPIVVLSAYVLLRHRERFVRFVLYAMLIGVPWLGFNMATLGQLLPPYYLVASGTSPTPGAVPFEGLLGIFVSPARGLLVYSPVVALVPWGLAVALREQEARPLALAYAAIIAASLGLSAQWAVWWGGHCYGPRLLTDIVPFLALFAAYAIDAARRQAARRLQAACAVLVVLSMAMQAPGALWWSSWTWNVDPANVDAHTERLWDWRDPPFLRQFR